MERYNLIDEPWITVLIDLKGNTKNISIRECFNEAENFIGLGGDTKTQDFAVLRFLLAICHTVYGRMDEKGEAYKDIPLNQKLQPIEWEVDDSEEHNKSLINTWINLWNRGGFSEAVDKYLNVWHDRFYLFGGDYPFYQIDKSVMKEHKLELLQEGNKQGLYYGKSFNRLLTESSNKISLFAYKSDDFKEILSEPEIARWLLTFHGYTGTSDKQTFRKKETDDTWSKGWLYDIGGIYLSGDNLFQTIMLNMALVHPEKEYQETNFPKPLWEHSPKEIVEYLMESPEIDNLAELYSNWSRAVYIDSKIDLRKGFECVPIKLPEVRHENQFLEIMTTWRYNETGINKNSYTPRKHQPNKALWRSFGLIALPTRVEEKQHQPGIIKWMDILKNHLKIQGIKINGVSMESDGNATSWVPINEVYDELDMNTMVLLDQSENGLMMRLYDEVEKTKFIIEKVYGGLIYKLELIRYGPHDGKKINSVKKINSEKEIVYGKIDEPFRQWLISLDVKDNMEEKIKEWRQVLQIIMTKEGKRIVEITGTRDFRGIETDKGIMNIPIAYNIYLAKLNKELGIKKEGEK